MKQEWIGRGALGLSVVTHVWILGATPAPVKSSPPPPHFTQMVEFEAVAPPPEQEPAPEPDLPERSDPEPEVEPVQAAAEPVIEDPSVLEEPPEAEPLPELSGTTLLADGPSDFSAEGGSGRSRRGAFVAGVSRVVERFAPPSRPQAPARPAAESGSLRAVPVTQLSRRPVAPSLGNLLRKNYPPEARRQGRSGQAKVRAMIDRSGKITQVHVVEQSDAAFGQACRKTLLGTHWGPPLDGTGSPVATWITYRCTFRVDD
jgi:TonB family protein